MSEMRLRNANNVYLGNLFDDPTFEIKNGMLRAGRGIEKLESGAALLRAGRGMIDVTAAECEAALNGSAL